MEIKDLAGLSEPLTRLIEVVASGVGTVTRPYFIRKNADAKSHEIRTITAAIKSAASDQYLSAAYKDGEISLWKDTLEGITTDNEEGRIIHRLQFQERKRQRNIEKITAEAASSLQDESSTPKEKPDDDWISRFFSAAQDVSSEELQILWGRILAGEIKKPGAFSLRTLDTIRNLTKRDAEVFQKVAKLSFGVPGGISVIPIHNKEWLQKNREIQPSHHFHLSELGLMFPTDLQFHCLTNAGDNEIALFGRNHIIRVQRSKAQGEIILPIWKFTDVGHELSQLVEMPYDEEWFDVVGRHFLSSGASAQIAKIIERISDQGIRYQLEREVKP